MDFLFIIMLYLQSRRHRCIYLPPENKDEVLILMLMNMFRTHIRNLGIVLPFRNATIRSRILEISEIPGNHQKRDVFTMLRNRPFEFWTLSGETVQSFNQIIVEISPRMIRCRYGERNMTLENRLLLTLIWLRQYPTYNVLSVHFGVSVATVWSVVKRMWLLLWEEYAQLITWPNRNSWQQKVGHWPEMPNVLGCIDGTSHEIFVPSTEPQEEFYSGHRKFHCIHTQVVIDNQKNICHVHSGFLGHDNDAYAYQRMKKIGPGQELDFPPNGLILADSIYPNTRPLVTPYKSVDIIRQPRLQRRRRRRFNVLHRKRRVYVEHVIKEIKTFKVIGSVYRHTRWELSCIVELCASLAKRRADMIREIE